MQVSFAALRAGLGSCHGTTVEETVKLPKTGKKFST